MTDYAQGGIVPMESDHVRVSVTDGEYIVPPKTLADFISEDPCIELWSEGRRIGTISPETLVKWYGEDFTGKPDGFDA